MCMQNARQGEKRKNGQFFALPFLVNREVWTSIYQVI